VPKNRGGGTALVVLDMLNTYEHPDAEALAVQAASALPGLVCLLDRAEREQVPVIYVNDNYGDWNSSAEELAEKATAGAHPELVEPILPRRGSSFVIKARHSAFYQTPLEHLLYEMKAERLLLAGQVTEQCVLYSAVDAYVRHFDVAVATDAVAAIDDELAAAALRMMEENLSVDLGSAATCSLGEPARA
jgi:nicotinamidase-related amidase